jgi:hypothetical protein
MEHLSPSTPTGKPHAAAEKIPPVESPRHDEALLDQALEETFPASDPISPAHQARAEAENAAAGRHPFGPRRLREIATPLLILGAAAIALLSLNSIRRGR